MIANRWLAIRLEFLGSLVTVAVALFIVTQPDAISPSQAGLVVTQSLCVTQVGSQGKVLLTKMQKS